MFLNWVDIFTPWHIRILLILELNAVDFQTTVASNNKMDTRQGSTHIIDKIDSLIPPNEINKNFITQVLIDLHNHRLIDVDFQQGHRPFLIKFTASITEMGKNFLKFISE